MNIDELNIDELNISNVRVEETAPFERGTLFIDFCIDGKTEFYLGFQKTTNDWKPLEIRHHFSKKISNTCHICKNIIERSACYAVDEHRLELGKILLNHPNVRLKLLFM